MNMTVLYVILAVMVVLVGLTLGIMMNNLDDKVYELTEKVRVSEAVSNAAFQKADAFSQSEAYGVLCNNIHVVQTGMQNFLEIANDFEDRLEAVEDITLFKENKDEQKTDDLN